MDLWIEKFSLALLVLAFGFTMYTTRENSTVCWCPAHFTDNHVSYANALCGSNASEKYTTFEPAEINESSPNPHPPQHDDTMEAVKMLKRLVIGEILFGFLVYCLTSCVTHSSNIDYVFPKDSLKTFMKVPLYLLMHVLVAVIWLAFAVGTHKNAIPDNKPPTVFMCDFRIRVVGNVQRYTVQCVNDPNDALVNAVFMNIGICMVFALVKLARIVALFLVNPCGKMKSIAARLVDLKIINQADELGKSFAFSDFYFALVVKGGKMLEKINQDSEVESKQIT